MTQGPLHPDSMFSAEVWVASFGDVDITRLGAKGIWVNHTTGCTQLVMVDGEPRESWQRELARRGVRSETIEQIAAYLALTGVPT